MTKTYQCTMMNKNWYNSFPVFSIFSVDTYTKSQTYLNQDMKRSLMISSILKI
jgi:hypothetical protein